MARGQLGHGFPDTRQQVAVPLDELRADPLDLAPQRLVMGLGSNRFDRAFQRDHIRPAAIAMTSGSAPARPRARPP